MITLIYREEESTQFFLKISTFTTFSNNQGFFYFKF